MVDRKDSSPSRVNKLSATQVSEFRESSRFDAPDASYIISIGPLRCRVSVLHDYLEEYLTEKLCRVEIESVATHGQLVSTLGRPLRDVPDHDVGIVCGVRRLLVARRPSGHLRVELRETCDCGAGAAMDTENQLRTDISPHRRWRGYARLFRAEYFRFQDEMAHALDVFAPQASLKMTERPRAAVSASASPLDPEGSRSLPDAS
jgi:hypothetical protein